MKIPNTSAEINYYVTSSFPEDTFAVSRHSNVDDAYLVINRMALFQMERPDHDVGLRFGIIEVGPSGQRWIVHLRHSEFDNPYIRA